MKQNYHSFNSKLQEIVNLQTELQAQKNTYTALQQAHAGPDVLKEIRLKIMRLREEIKEKERDALTLFN